MLRRPTEVNVVSALAMLAVASIGAPSDGLETRLQGNFTMGRIRSETTSLEADIEPRILISGDPGWRNIDVTSPVEYDPGPGSRAAGTPGEERPPAGLPGQAATGGAGDPDEAVF